MKCRLLPMVSLVCLFAVCTAPLSAQTARGQNQNVELSKTPVFVANPEAMAAKRKWLEQIDSVAGRENRPPNVVLILADDLGYGDLSVHGSRTIPTPHIDALAASGTRFTDAYVTAGSCSPSRAGLMSGRYQQRFGFEFNTSSGPITHRNSRGLDPAAVTLADVFQSAGYATGMFGKWHLGTRDFFHPQQRGFDEFVGFLAGAHSFFQANREEPVYSTMMRGTTPYNEPEYLTDAFARETVKFIHAHQDEPFFVYTPFNAVHTPLEATQKYLDRFPSDENEKQQAYNAMTSALDDAVGSILQAINDINQTENTLVIFLNDNGGPIYTKVQSNGPLRLGKLFLFEGGIRIPIIAKLPGVIKSGSVYESPVSSLDVFPTTCAVAGINIPSDLKLDGVNLLPHLNGQQSDVPHDTLFWSNGPNRAVRMGDWKLIVAGEHRFLFNLKDDLGETTNLIDEHSEQAQQLEEALKAWKSEMKPPAWPSKPDRKIFDIDGVPYEVNI